MRTFVFSIVGADIIRPSVGLPIAVGMCKRLVFAPTGLPWVCTKYLFCYVDFRRLKLHFFAENATNDGFFVLIVQRIQIEIFNLVELFPRKLFTKFLGYAIIKQKCL